MLLRVNPWLAHAYGAYGETPFHSMKVVTISLVANTFTFDRTTKVYGSYTGPTC